MKASKDVLVQQNYRAMKYPPVTGMEVKKWANSRIALLTHLRGRMPDLACTVQSLFHLYGGYSYL
jgi:hypothetical protein